MKVNAMKTLAGYRVLELGNSEAAGVCTLLLSDFGAEVIRLKKAEEKESGNRTCDRGKQILELDPNEPEEIQKFENLVQRADIVIDGRTGRQRKEGGSYESLRKLRCGMIYTAITPYGMEGPYSDCEANENTIQAESGLVSITGQDKEHVVRAGGDVAGFAGGLNACIATLIALLERERRGQISDGKVCDVSMMDSILYGLENQFSIYMASDIIPEARGNRYALSAPVGNFSCKDGKQIMISVATQAQWKTFCEAIGHPEWVIQPEYETVARRLENCDQLDEDVAKVFLQYTREEVIRRLQSRKCVYGCINDFSAVVNHPQVKERKLFVREGDREDGPMVPADPLLVDGIRPTHL